VGNLCCCLSERPSGCWRFSSHSATQHCGCKIGTQHHYRMMSISGFTWPESDLCWQFNWLIQTGVALEQFWIIYELEWCFEIQVWIWMNLKTSGLDLSWLVELVANRSWNAIQTREFEICVELLNNRSPNKVQKSYFCSPHLVQCPSL